MRHGKEKIGTAEEGTEFGAILDGSVDFKVTDVLVSYRPASKNHA